MSRRPDLRVARFADVQLVTLTIQDEQRAREFVARTLGKLADADRELRDTLCVYIGEQFSAARAARALDLTPAASACRSPATGHRSTAKRPAGSLPWPLIFSARSICGCGSLRWSATWSKTTSKRRPMTIWPVIIAMPIPALRSALSDPALAAIGRGKVRSGAQFCAETLREPSRVSGTSLKPGGAGSGAVRGLTAMY
jgi:hypothetical protein